MPDGRALVALARQSMGVNYVWGGNDLKKGVDCSGLTQQVYAAFGIEIPRVTYDQINTGYSVPMDKLYAGDLVFFDTDRKKAGPDHVGIYIGGGKFIHAPKQGDVVKISSLTDSYYNSRWMGGRRIPGVSGGGDVPIAELEQAPPQLDETELAERYGMSYAFFESQPELMGLLKEAVSETMTNERFTAKLKGTKWWAENSATARQAQVLAKSDPATYKAQMEAQRALVQQAAIQLGAVLTDKQLNTAARDSLAYQWNEAQMQNFLGSYVNFTKNHVLGGQAGTIAKQIAGIAYGNGLRLSEQTVKNYAQYVVKGVSTMQDVENNLRTQAVNAYPGFADQISAGASVRDIASPYIQMMSKELGIPDAKIDLHNTQISDALNRKGSKGEPSPMSLSDFQDSLRNDVRWRSTPRAANEAMSAAHQVLRDMGLV